jgi:hypothetical protein
MSGRDGLELSSDSDDGAPVYNGAPAQLIRSRGDTQAGMAVAEEQQQYSSSDSSSSGEEEEDEHQRHEEADAVLKVDDEFDSFEDLQLVATRCCLCKLSHNPRKENAVAARKWLKDLLPNLSHYHTSGSLYCFQAFTTLNQLKHARTSCNSKSSNAVHSDIVVPSTSSAPSSQHERHSMLQSVFNDILARVVAELHFVLSETVTWTGPRAGRVTVTTELE